MRMRDLSSEAKKICKAIQDYIEEYGRWHNGQKTDDWTLASAASDVMDGLYSDCDPPVRELVGLRILRRVVDSDRHKTWELTELGKQNLDPRRKEAMRRRAVETPEKVAEASAKGFSDAARMAFV